jgi:DNA-binding MarR family transcriptional regulator
LGKTIKLLLIVLVPLILLTIPNTSADNLGEEGDISEGDHERPTLLPDLTVSSIAFSQEKFEEENIMIIEATIRNNGFVGAYSYIEFYDGKIETENLIGSGSLFVKRRDTNEISMYWKASSGEHKIHVLIKDSIPRELIKRNNEAEATVVVAESDGSAGNGGDGGDAKNVNVDNPVALSSLSLDNPVVATGVTSSFALLLFALANKHYYWFGSLGVLPLYSRITNGQVLKQNTRKSIYDYIVSNPGVNFSTIMKDLELKNGVTSYHLSMLEREGYIKSKYTGLYRRFYVNGASTRDFPQSKIRREIIQTIVNNPGISQTQIATYLGVSNQVVNYHIGILRNANFIKIVKDGFRTKCFIGAV